MANWQLISNSQRPLRAESDRKRLLLGGGSGQSGGTFWYASLSELPLMPLSGWPLSSPITGHCNALSAILRH
jgi:hypothetical protein